MHRPERRRQLQRGFLLSISTGKNARRIRDRGSFNPPGTIFSEEFLGTDKDHPAELVQLLLAGENPAALHPEVSRHNPVQTTHQQGQDQKEV